MHAPPFCEEVTTKTNEEVTATQVWSIGEHELGYHAGEPINIGWICSDRICQSGSANKLALLWEDYQGSEKRFTYDEVRTLSNTIAHFLLTLGIQPGERVK